MSPEPSRAAAVDLPTEALGKFRVLFKSVRRHFQDVERRCGVSGSELWALATVVNRPGLRVSELARQLSIHQSTASNLVESLSRKELVRRERCSRDRRVVQLFACERSRSVLEKAPKPVEGLLPHALAQLTDADLFRLNAAMDGLLAAMRKRKDSDRFTPLSDA